MNNDNTERAEGSVPTKQKWQQHKQYRLLGYDYSFNGAYFITIVTKNRECFFGEIETGKMMLSAIGEFVKRNFETIKEQVHHLHIDNYTIMPNHLHLIVNISTRHEKKHELPVGIQPLIPKSISVFINQLKGSIKKWCNNNKYEYFQWQSKFHDRIIRNEMEYNNISNYINNNVANWHKNI